VIKANGRAPDGFTALRNQVFSIASARNHAEVTARMTGALEMVDGLKGFVGALQAQIQRLVNVLAATTDGTIALALFKLPDPRAQVQLEFFDAVGTQLHILEPTGPVVLLLPTTILPLRAKVTERGGAECFVDVDLVDPQTGQPIAITLEMEGQSGPYEPMLSDAARDVALEAVATRDPSPLGDEAPPSLILGADGRPAR
jgi:hypothetical protein